MDLCVFNRRNVNHIRLRNGNGEEEAKKRQSINIGDEWTGAIYGDYFEIC
jgi:hypothetical protein